MSYAIVQVTDEVDRVPELPATFDPDIGDKARALWSSMNGGILPSVNRYSYSHRKSHIVLFSIVCDSIFNADAACERACGQNPAKMIGWVACDIEYDIDEAYRIACAKRVEGVGQL